ncbi:uncharacterized protein [Nicotiana tomentosiformis]|uniref:uncharacterized protein n=1 Tax=Nicotiana tomentosiformis TaxID=4098 RepID=UPI00388C4952
MEGEKVLLQVPSPMKGMMQFWNKGQLNPSIRVRKVAYTLALPPSLARVHPIFHVSILWKYHEDRSHVFDLITVQLDENLTYEEEPMAILHRRVQQLRSKDIPFVKVYRIGQSIEEATYDFESDMRSRYPLLFTISGTFLYPFEDEHFYKKLRM